MAIGMPLPEFNDLETFGDPPIFFQETNFIYNDLHIVQNWTKKIHKLKIKISVHGTSNPAILQSFVKSKITLKTGLQDCRVGIECFKCAVDFLLELPIILN